MKRRVWVWSSCVLLLLAIVGTLAWTMATTQGARWVIHGISRLLPVSIEVNKITGRLAGDLMLEGIRIQWPEGEIRAEGLTLTWRPLHLLKGNVVVKRLTLREVSIHDKRPGTRKPLDLAWPTLPAWLALLDGQIEVFRIDGLAYRNAGPGTFRLDHLAGRIIWYKGTLIFNDLDAQSPEGKLEGAIGAGFSRPSLYVDLTVMPVHPAATMDKFLLKARLEPAPRPEQVSGPLSVAGMSGGKDRYIATGRMGITQHGVKLEALRITEQGREGEIQGVGAADFSSAEPRVSLQLRLTKLNATKGLGIKTNVSGDMSVESDLMSYQGSFDLRNQDPSWKMMHLRGRFGGDWDGVKVTNVFGGALEGTLEGAFEVSWAPDVAISGTLRGRGFDPARITPQWQGQINANLDGRLRWSPTTSLEGVVTADLLQSTLRKKALTGKVAASWRRGVLHLTALDAHGDGFDVSAQGVLGDRLTYHVRVNDLSGLIPDSKGRFIAQGWTRWKDKELSGSITSSGSSLSTSGLSVAAFNLEGELSAYQGGTIRAKARMRNIEYGQLQLASVQAHLDGTLSDHVIEAELAWVDSKMQTSLTGRYGKGAWDGMITRLTVNTVGSDPFKLARACPFAISATRVGFSDLQLTAGPQEKLDVNVDLHLNPVRGSVKTRWGNMNLARAEGMLAGLHLSGRASGSFEATWLPDERLMMTGSTGITDTLIKGPLEIRIATANGTLHWDEKGLSASWAAGFSDAGSAEGTFSAAEPARFGMPQTGDARGALKSLDVAILKAWLPSNLEVQGRLSGEFHGKVLPESRLEVAAGVKMSEGRLAWRTTEGVIAASPEKADCDLLWKDSALTGDLSFILSGYGHVNSTFRVPLPARLPARIQPNGPMSVQARGELREKGILATLFPGLVEETKGQIDFQVGASGTWENPDLQGRLNVTGAGAFLPAAGIRLEDVAAKVELNGDRINCTSFSARSGTGDIKGSATVLLKNRRIVHYTGKLSGERFQAIYVPELQILASPDLSFEGDNKQLVLRGSILVPQAEIHQTTGQAAARTSRDVVIVDAPPKKQRRLGLGFDAQVTVIMGDRVHMSAEGIDGRLEGRVLVAGHDLDTIHGSGQLRIVNGKYNGYGVKLDITRGNIVFGGGPVDLATLDILASRTIRDPNRLNDIRAGVTVTGTTRSPLVKLYSQPAMSDAEVLSYMVLARPLAAGTASAQNAALLQTAGALLARDQSATAQTQLKRLLGIDTIDIEQKTVTSATGATSTGASGSESSSGVARSLVTVGKYLSPELYVAFGRSLFSDEYLLTARYSFLKRWQVESKTGLESAVDLYYRIDLD